MRAVLLPGFNGAASQPILRRLEAKLELLDIECSRRALTRGKPSLGLERERAQLHGFVGKGPVVLIGRSFGGRVCARYAALHPVEAVVLLGFPVRPAGKPRPDDEAALLALTCPTLIVQGDVDLLGPLKVLQPLVKKNAALTLHIVKGAGHSFGRHEGPALDAVAAWLEDVGVLNVSRAL
jgi:predicted alpha/beta-hydrolase family hydrolase